MALAIWQISRAAQPLRDQPCTAAHTQQSGFTLLHAWTSRRLSMNFAFEEQCAVRARKEAKTQARPIPSVPTLRVMECCRYVKRCVAYRVLGIVTDSFLSESRVSLCEVGTRSIRAVGGLCAPTVSTVCDDPRRPGHLRDALYAFRMTEKILAPLGTANSISRDLGERTE